MLDGKGHCGQRNTPRVLGVVRDLEGVQLGCSVGLVAASSLQCWERPRVPSTAAQSVIQNDGRGQKRGET